MPGIFDIAGPQFGIKDAKIAVNNLDGTWGTPVDVPSVQVVGGTEQYTTAELTGDDTITDRHSKLIAVQMRMRWGSIHLDVSEIINGTTVQETGTPNSANHVRYQRRAGGTNSRYFGLCGLIEPTQGSGGLIVFFPKLKTAGDIQVQFEYGSYSIPEFEAQGVADDAYDDMVWELIQYATLQQIQFPPLYVI